MIIVSWHCPECSESNEWEMMRGGLERNARRVIREHAEQAPTCGADVPQIELTYRKEKT